jgi:hypothetical protein
MPRAVLRNGVICPLEMLPSEWSDGQELHIEALVDEDDDRDLDDWYRQLETLVAANDPNDWARVEDSIRIADEQAKANVRKQMGLP